jgi:hypothetical protein
MRVLDGMNRMKMFAAFLAGMLAGLPSGVAQRGGQTSRQALEEAVRKARANLPRRAPEYGSAASEMAGLDPQRAAALVEEALRLVPPGRWRAQSAEYYMVQSPFGALAQVDFDRAAELAMRHPARLLPLLEPAYQGLVERDLPAAERWGRDLVRRAPNEGASIVHAAAQSRAWMLSERPGTAGDAAAVERAKKGRESFFRLAEILPPGPPRASLWLQAGMALLDTERSEARRWLLRAVAEAPGAQPELDWGLWAAAGRQAPAAETAAAVTSAEVWKRLAEEYRALGSEAGTAGIVRRIRLRDAAAAWELAGEIHDPAVRALALSEFLEPRGENRGPEPRQAADQIPGLLPAIERPVLRAFVAYRLGAWEEVRDLPSAAARFRLAFDAVASRRDGRTGIFGNQEGSLSVAQIRTMLLGHLAHRQPEAALRLALDHRRSLEGGFRLVLLHAAAHAPSAARAEQWLRTYLPRGAAAMGRRDYAAVLAGTRPEQTATLALKMKPGPERDTLLVVAASALAERHPEAALALAPAFKSDAACSAGLLAAARAARPLGAEAMLTLARRIPRPLTRADAMVEIADGILNEAPPRPGAAVERARQIAAEMPDEGPKWQLMERLAGVLSGGDPEAAFRYALDIGRYTERLRAEAEALGLLIPERCQRAFELAGQEPSEEGRVDLAASLGARLAATDPEAAIGLADRIDHRPTREQVLAAAILALPERDLDRALALAATIVTRAAAQQAFPRLWLAALKAGKAPRQVGPLYWWIAQNAYSAWGWERVRARHSTGPDEEQAPGEGAGSPDRAYQSVVAQTAEWLQKFPREEWLSTLRPHLRAPQGHRIDGWFLTHVALRLAASDPGSAIALVEAAAPGDAGWIALVPALAAKDLADGEKALARLQSPAARLSAAITLSRVATGKGLPADRYREEALRQAARLAEQVPRVKTPGERAGQYLAIAGQLRYAGLDNRAYLRAAWREAARVRDALERAQVLRAIDRVERAN